MTPYRWCPHADAVVRTLHAGGASDVTIAAVLGCVSQTVCDRRRGLGLPANPWKHPNAPAGAAAWRARGERRRAARSGWDLALTRAEVRVLDALNAAGAVPRGPWLALHDLAARLGLRPVACHGYLATPTRLRWRLRRLAARGAVELRPGRGPGHPGTVRLLCLPARSARSD